MAERIEFGTDGWRAVIADGFTFENVRKVTNAIAVAARSLEPPDDVDRNTLVVGYDRRFLSKEFAEAVAQTLADAGYTALLSTAPIPSQTVSFTARHRSVLGGVMVTASHNPAAYNGLKFKGWYGGSALPETYAAIADCLGRSDSRGGGSVTEIDLLDDYVAALRNNVDTEAIRLAGLRILHDPIHGVAAGLPSRVLGDSEGTVVQTIRGELNPAFGGVNPEPIPQNLELTRRSMTAEVSVIGHPFDLAICNDGDADRLGILDEKGRFVSPHEIISLLALYLVREKKQKGEIVKTFSTTRLVENIARALGRPLHETPIGFKYVADLMLSREILIGGEESGGIGFGFFLPERDGILSGLLVAELVAHYGKPLSEIIGAMEEEFGRLYYDRRDLHRAQSSIDDLMVRLARGDLDRSFGEELRSREQTDGIKLNFADGSWLLFRKSGTEPIIRLYCESPGQSRVQALLDHAVGELDRS